MVHNSGMMVRILIELNESNIVGHCDSIAFNITDLFYEARSDNSCCNVLHILYRA